jgi:hypothetical protein
MKAHRLLQILFLFTFVPLISFAQEEKPKLQYSAGFGTSIDGNNLLWGLNVTNELNVKLGKRTSFVAGFTFYQSLGNLENQALISGQKSKDQSSGIFISPKFKYDIIQHDSGFKLSFAIGPSLQLGGDSYQSTNSFFNPGDQTNLNYFVNKYRRIGLVTELEAEWNSKNPNRKNAVSISAYGFDNYYPWYLNATYKVRFNLGKK